MLKHAFLLLALGLALAGAAEAQVAVVAHPGVPAASIDVATLNGIYGLDRQKWSDGSAVRPFDLQDGLPAKAAFYGALGRSADDFKKVWLRKKLAGEGQPPETAASEAALLQRVAATPGAVGFVSAGAVDGSVKVLATLN